MANMAEASTIELPAALQARIEAVRRRLRQLHGLLAAGASATGVAVSFLTFYAWERSTETPPLARWLLWGAGIACGLVPPAVWIWRWIWQPPDAREIACRIQRRLPQLGDRLLGAVELAAPPAAERVRWSEALRRAAIEQVAREADFIDVRSAAPGQTARTIAATAVAGLCAVALLVLRQPEAAWNALQRWLNPAAPVPRFTFVQIEELPAELIVPHGEPFELECTVRRGAARRAVFASCRVGRAVWTHAIGSDGRVRFRIPGPTRTTQLALRIGDAIRHVRLRPEHRPALVELNATVRPPPWHGRPEETRRLESGWLAVPEGGEVVLSGRATRELVQMTLNGPDGPPVTVSGALFEAVRLVAATGGPPSGAHTLPGELVLNWRDCWGLTPSAPTHIRIQRLPDAPPSVRCEGLEGAVAILEDETLRFDVIASDDHGVQKLWLEWRTAPEGAEITPAVHTRALARGEPDATALRTEVSLSPDVMQWPADTIIDLWAAAVDHVPNRAPSYSPLYRIFVLSRARHAQLLEQRAQAVQAVIEELRRREEGRWQASEEISALADDQILNAMTEDRLRTGELGEQRDAERAAQLAEEIAGLAVEALRNPTIPEATVLDWATVGERLQSLAAGAMRSATQALRSAANTREQSQRRELARQAADHQRAALDQLTEALREASRTGDEWAAGSFVERLRELAARQNELANVLARHAPALLGLYPERITPELRQELVRLGELQSKYRQLAEHLRDDLTGFFERSRRPVYDEVARAMSEPDVLSRQAENRRAILHNQLASAMQMSAMLAEDFARWADMLSPREGDFGGGRGRGGGATPSVPMDVLVGLLRARARQEGLREATRELERQRPHRQDYPIAAEALADRQLQIELDLRKLNDRVGGRILSWMETIEQEMIVSAATLREPQTDAAAIAIQTGIIEAIAEVMNAGSASPTSAEATPSAEAMAAISRMLQTLAQRGGGSLAGGTTSGEHDVPRGTDNGRSPEGRAPQRSATAIDEVAPAEFRQLLEGYFRAIETGP